MLLPKRGTKPRWWGFSRGAGRIRVSLLMSAGWVGPLVRSRFAAVAGVYVLGIAVAGALVAGGVHRLAVALMDEPVSQTAAVQPAIQRSQNLAKQAPISRIPPAGSQ